MVLREGGKREREREGGKREREGGRERGREEEGGREERGREREGGREGWEEGETGGEGFRYSAAHSDKNNTSFSSLSIDSITSIIAR